MNSVKFIGAWTIGMMAESSETREKIEVAFNEMAKAGDDWFYKIVVNGKDFFICDNGERGYTCLLPSEY